LSTVQTAESFRQLWETLVPVGRHGPTGGYRRYAWSAADLECREWFRDQAAARGLDVETDRNGNLWAWWGQPGPDAVVTGSHLDSVPDGGAYDGPLGIVSGFAAVDVLRQRGVHPVRPVAVVAFSDEEGARFGVACVGSRLATGALDPDRARALRDPDGTTLAEAMKSAGHDPQALGRDDERLRRVAAFVELHVEQGRALVDLAAPVGVASAIWPHGRWRFDFTGTPDHAGTTRLVDRNDPMLPFALLVLAARDRAMALDALATVGKVRVEPNATNAIASAVHAWLDARAPDEATVAELVADLTKHAGAVAADHGVRLTVERESWSPLVEFGERLRDRVAACLTARTGAPVPLLPTGAGHDAGVLAADVPTAMLFVRNPSGVSHSPLEHADESDCLAGVAALADVLEDLACQ
jgi:N-carbamoyl-L-amino-acid hydrolase